MKIKTIISIFLLLAFSSAIIYGAVVGYELLEPIKEDFNKYPATIIVDEEVTIYVGEKYILAPYLINENGELENGKYTYTSTSNQVTVSINGEVTVLSVPDDDVYIDIEERTTGAKAKVHLNIISDLYGVEKIVPLESQSGQLHQMLNNATYSYEVVTLPKQIDIESYFQYEVYSNGEKKNNVFAVTYDGNKVNFKALGLGSGQIKIAIKNSRHNVNFETTINFDISLPDKNFTQAVLSSANKQLLSQEELQNVQKVVFNDNINKIDFTGISVLTSLKTIIFETDEVVTLNSKVVPVGMFIRVKDTTFTDYLNDDIWKNLSNYIIPYEDNYNDVYIVYHSEFVQTLFYEKVDVNYQLKKLTYQGYTLIHWLDKDNQIFTDLNSLTEGIHLYARWDNNAWKINFVDYESSTPIPSSKTVYYNEKIGPLPQPTKLDYVFAGWYLEEDYETLYDEDTIYLYDEDITLYAKYTGVFTLNYDAFDTRYLDVVYGKTVTLPVLENQNGWEFKGWFTSEDVEYTSGVYKGYGYVILNAKWVSQLTFVNFDGDDTLVDVVYNQKISGIPTIIKDNYRFDGWHKDLTDSDSYLNVESNYTDAGNLTFYPKLVTTIGFDYQDATVNNGPNNFEVIYNMPLPNLPQPYKNGYEFMGWYTLQSADGTKFTSGQVYKENSGVYLYAAWKTTLYFYKNGTDANQTADQVEVIYKKGYSINDPVYTNAAFAGWYTEKGGAGTQVPSSTLRYEGPGELKIYAKILVTLEYDYQGQASNTSVTEVTVVAFSKVGALEKPVSTIYDFAGWYTGQAGTGDYLHPDYIVTNLTRIKIYAKWTKNVLVHINDDGLHDKTVTLTYKGQIGVIDTFGYTRNGMKFLGYKADNILLTETTIFDFNTFEFNGIWEYSETATGKGTSDSPYLIYYREQLDCLSQSVNSGNNYLNYYFKLAANIDMGNQNFIPIGNNNNGPYHVNNNDYKFNGIFDGGGYHIINLKVNVTSSGDSYGGLFGFIGKSGIVKNIVFDNATINVTSGKTAGTKGGAHGGIVAGINSGTIDNCTTYGTVNGSAQDTHYGGIVGYMFEAPATVTNCKNYAAINGTATRWASHGGICGSSNNAYINNCYNYATINGKFTGSLANRYLFFGGITGVNAGYIINCVNSGTITGSYDSTTNYAVAFFGGIAGYVHNGSGSNENGQPSDTNLPITSFYLDGQRNIVILGSSSTGTLSFIPAGSVQYYYSDIAGIIEATQNIKIRVQNIDRSRYNPMLYGNNYEFVNSNKSYSITLRTYDSNNNYVEKLIYRNVGDEVVVEPQLLINNVFWQSWVVIAIVLLLVGIGGAGLYLNKKFKRRSK